MDKKINLDKDSVSKSKTFSALSKRASCFFTCAGNGRKVPQYELVDGKSRLKVTKDGEVVTKDLTAEINMCKDVNDYKKFLDANNGNLQLVEEHFGKASESEYFDSTKFGDAHSVLNAQARVKDRYPDQNLKTIREKYEMFVKDMQAKVEELKKQQLELQKKQEESGKNEK